jgi:hypothetical protein
MLLPGGIARSADPTSDVQRVLEVLVEHQQHTAVEVSRDTQQVVLHAHKGVLTRVAVGLDVWRITISIKQWRCAELEQVERQSC